MSEENIPTMVIDVRYRGKDYSINIPTGCTLKELYLEMSRQMAPIDPNGEICFERQAMATDGW